MLTYCLKGKKIQRMYVKVLTTKNGRTMSLSKWALCSSKKSRFMKKQEAKG